MEATAMQETPEVTKIPKKPGWELLKDAADAIIAADNEFKGCVSALHPREAAKLFLPLGDQCRLRINEIIPADHLDEVIDAVIAASVLQGYVWYGEMLDFIISQAGQERIDRFLAENEDWTLMVCTCGDPAHGDTVATKAFAEASAKYSAHISGIADAVMDIFSTFIGPAASDDSSAQPTDESDTAEVSDAPASDEPAADQPDTPPADDPIVNADDSESPADAGAASPDEAPHG